MRLTLRTLLAYLDEILEPEDREALSEKIEESEFAKSLIERTDNVIGSPQLGAPQPLGRGLSRDPNSVAEYLDNTMAPEQIQEFERICLESDLHLAEVTSCHRVLTMVLGEAVQFDASSRERMYRLAQGKVVYVDKAHTAGFQRTPEIGGSDIAGDEIVGSAIANNEVEQPATEIKRRAATTGAAANSITSEIQKSADTFAKSPAETSAAALRTGDSVSVAAESKVPDYLRGETKSRFWPLALTALVAAITTGGLLMALDPEFAGISQTNGDANKEPNGRTPNGKIGGDPALDPAGVRTPAIDPVAGAVTNRGTVPATGIETPDLGAPTPGPGVETGVSDAGPAENAGTDGGVVAPPDPGPGPDLETPTDVGPGPGTGVPLVVTPPATSDVPDVPVDTTTDGATDGNVDPDAAPGDGSPLPPPADGGTDGSPPPDRVASIDPIATDPPTTVDPDEVPLQPTVMGRLLSHNQVLLAKDRGSDDLRRLAVQSTLNAGQKLIVLPTFRPMISLADTTIDIDSGTMIELTGMDENGIPEITVHYGRFVARALSMPNSGLRLRLGDQEGIMTLQEASSAVGIEVRPFRIPGSDPEKVPSHRAVDIYAISGNAGWKIDAGQQVIQAGVRRVLSPHPNETPASRSSSPEWLNNVQISALDERAVSWIEQGIRSDRSVKLSLAELADHQRTEIRRVAMRCCAHIGYFDPLIKSLNDPEMRPRWNLYIPELRAAIAAAPENAMMVRESFERLRGQHGFDLYRMLWGYGSTGLTKNGEAAALVAYLDHEDLDFRVLSFWNLQDITGIGLNYRPEYPELKRRQSIGRWKDRLQRGEIVPAENPKEPAPSSS